MTNLDFCLTDESLDCSMILHLYRFLGAPLRDLQSEQYYDNKVSLPAPLMLTEGDVICQYPVRCFSGLPVGDTRVFQGKCKHVNTAIFQVNTSMRCADV